MVQSHYKCCVFPYGFALVHTGAKYMTSTHVHSLYKQNMSLADLLETKKVQEAKFTDCNGCISIHFASVYFDEK